VKLTSALLVVGTLLLSTTAFAQDAVYASPAPGPIASEGGGLHDTTEHERPMTASAMLYVPWIYGIGIGGKFGFEIPVAKNGFIPKLNDSVSIEPSLSMAYTSWYGLDSSHGALFLPAVSGLWNFHLKPDLRVYGAVNVGVNIYSIKWDGLYNDNGRHSYFRPYVELAGGVFWKFNDRMALRGELGWYGPRGGISFFF